MAQSPTVLIRPNSSIYLGLRELWQYREVLFSLVQRDIKIRYKQTLIGVLWVVIQPLFMVAVFTLFLGRLAKIPSGDLPYPVFALSGFILWNYFASALGASANSLIEYKAIISKVYFPRLILPLAPILVGGVDFLINLALLVAFAAIYGIPIKLTFLLTPVFFLITAFTVLSVGLWLAGLNAMYRDVRYVLPFFIQLWMFASPVVYPSSLIPENWRWAYALNPMTLVLEGFRWCIAGRGEMPIIPWLSLLMLAVIFIGGLFFFRKIERTLADWI
ncbi:MAG: ABC transporter permease [Bacteroidia bacterium]|nr:ABC transporter permease [Bacteroidia bacterium]MCX7764700.1 ABC transporter permease [Bacteroidia bacterium]MDW8057721.1 ABC transporter permease [Bacteroidia bacterium]